MPNKQYISSSLIRAVSNGNEDIVKKLINTYGLSYSDAWLEGYRLLCDALINKQSIVASILLNYNCKVNNNNIRCRTPLHWAVKNGDIEIVNMLLYKGANIEAKAECGQTPLHYAICNEHYEVAELLLSNKSDINARDNDGKSPIYYAVVRKDLRLVEILLKYGAVVHPEDVNDDQLFYNAIKNGFVKIVEDLLQFGALDVNKIFKRTNRALIHEAVFWERENITRLLISYDANLNVQDKYECTPLFYAIKNNDLKMTQLLLQHKADINHINKDGMNVLHTAAASGYSAKIEEMVTLLLSNGADLNAKQKDDGSTALHLALQKNNYIFIKELLEYCSKDNSKMDINCRNWKGRTALHIAILYKRYEVIELLLRHKADANARDYDGRSLLYFAIERQNSRIVEILLQYGAVVHPEDVNDDKLFYNAITNGFVKIVEGLLKFGALDIYKIFKRTNRAPIHEAVLYKQENITRLLISYGANLNVKDKRGNTPLFYAIENNDLNMTKLLLQHKADINHINKEGMNALQYVAAKEIQEMATLILNDGAINVNAKRKDNGMTALHLAAGRKNHRFIKELLEYCVKVDTKMDIDINCTNKFGETALDIAILTRNVETVRTLLDYGSNINYSKLNQSVYYLRQENSTLGKVLVSHLVKLKTANLYVNEENLILIGNKNDEIRYFENKCEQEIVRMKNKKITNTNFSFYDILTKLGKNTFAATWLRNENIEKGLTIEDYKGEFPIYGNMITGEFRKGMKRYSLLGQSIEMWYCVFNNVTPQLPHDCVERVFSYLTNEDLKIFNRCL